MIIVHTNRNKEHAIFSGYISDDLRCAQMVVDNYYWIAEYVAGKFSKLGSDEEVLESIAYDALMHAAADYSLSCGKRFGVFALTSIREAVYQAVLDDSLVAHRAVSVTDTLIQTKNAINILRNNLKNDSTDWEASQALEIDEDELRDIIYDTPTINKQEIRDVSRQGFSKIKKTPSHISRNLLRKASESIDKLISSVENDE